MRRAILVYVACIALLGTASTATASGSEEQDHRVAEEFSAAVGATVLSVVYFPVKLGVSLGGAFLGGLSGFVTGGEARSAQGVWGAVVDGNYFVRPGHILGEEQFRLNGAYSEDDLEVVPSLEEG